MKFSLLLVIGFIASGSAWAAATDNSDILIGLRPEHPRLIITNGAWNQLKLHRSHDPELEAILTRSVADARSLLAVPPVVYKKDGKRLLAVSREAMRRIEILSFSYRVTGESVFLERAKTEMLTVAAFADWNPPHFLDTAEMTAGMALGYDWLFDALSGSTRAVIRQAMVEKGIQPGLAVHNGWQTGHNNWNQVCFGGLSLGALAVAEDYPDLARELLIRARKNNPNGLKPYAPDGIYPEGPGYWNYGTTYQVLLLSALETALGTDWNLSASPGFLASASALVEQTSPAGRTFNYSDCGEGLAFDPALFWFAKKLQQPSLVCFQNQLLQRKLAVRRRNPETDRFAPLLALWATGLPKDIPPPALPLAWHGNGPNPVGVFRSSWTDSNALFLAFKGGSPGVNHAHMDAGSFVLDADGVRWACDLGSQEYLSVESKGWGLWDGSQGGDRWRVYRLNNFSHNTLTLGGQLQRVAGDARITAFTPAMATVDLSSLYAGQAGSVLRHFRLGDNRAVRIQDEISTAKPGLTVNWQMVTHAKISLQDTGALIHQQGKTLAARIISPAGAHFEITSAQPPEDGVNQPNPGARILTLKTVVPASGKLTMEIELLPATTGAGQ